MSDQGKPPEVVEKNLARENGAWRLKLRAAEQRIAQLEAQLGGAKPTAGETVAGLLRGGGDGSEAPQATSADPTAAAGTPPPEAPAADLSAADLSADEELEQLELRVVTQELEKAGALYPRESAELFKSRKSVEVDDAGNVFVKIEGQKHPLTEETISRVLPNAWLRARGVAGTGSRGGTSSVRDSGFNYEKGLSDPAHFRKYEKEMAEEIRRRNGR